MKRDFLILMVLLLCVPLTTVWGACPEDLTGYDAGICDSIYWEPWLPDVADSILLHAGPYFVRVPIYVTHDVVDPATDSIAAFTIPLCFTHTNIAKYCSLSAYWNNTISYTNPRSIFRHLVAGTDTVHNWMMDLYNRELGEEWNFVTLDLTTGGNTHFWLSLVPFGSEDPRFGSANKVLLATMTFKQEDTMRICIDSCFWPPTGRLTFTRSAGGDYIPRLGYPHGTSYEKCFYADVKEIKGSDDIKPSDFSLSQNYPNPFNPTTNFQFTLPKSSHVKIEIFNIVGQKVAILVDGDMKPGVYNADWNGRDESGKTVSSGIYFYRMQAGDFSNMKKMVLVK